MNIERYKFGEMTIDGAVFVSDLIISDEKIHTRWCRQEGHIVRLSDIEKWISPECKLLVIGTGASGLCRVLPEVVEFCKTKQIELKIEPTEKAVKIYNSVEDKTGVTAAFHLTC